MYDPKIGRWVKSDPYGVFFDSAYTGMENDPVNAVDPNGGIYIPPVSGMSKLRLRL